jgi:hypothetical protein
MAAMSTNCPRPAESVADIVVFVHDRRNGRQ